MFLLQSCRHAFCTVSQCPGVSPLDILVLVVLAMLVLRTSALSTFSGLVHKSIMIWIVTAVFSHLVSLTFSESRVGECPGFCSLRSGVSLRYMCLLGWLMVPLCPFCLFKGSLVEKLPTYGDLKSSQIITSQIRSSQKQ